MNKKEKAMLETTKDRPWVKFYRENVPANLEYPNGGMVEMIETAALKYPFYIAYEYYGKLVTYKEFVRKIKLAARSLKALGIEAGDKITVCMPNTPEGITIFYAINMVGAIANMIHPLSSENEIEFYINNVESNMLITIDVSLEKIMSIADHTKLENIIVASASEDMPKVLSGLYWLTSGRKINIPKDDRIILWRDFIKKGIDYLGEYRVHLHAEDPALVLYSGGTTGKPKGILLSNLNFNALAMGSHLMADPSKAGDSVLSIMPIFHGFGIGVCIHTPLSIGMKCILIPAFSFKKFTGLVKKYKPNFLAGVPTLFESLTKNNFGPKDLECVTCVISGGDLLTDETKRKVDAFLSEHGSIAKVRQGFGLTECAGASCLTPTDYYKPGTIGIPYPDTRYKIVKTGTHTLAELGTDGEICINGPSVMMGYWNDETETIQTLRMHEDGRIWLHTGDIGCMDEDGFVFFKQRLKRIIVSSGYNIYPSYIENIINSHPDVLTSTVIGIDHPHKVQVAKAFIVLKDGAKESDDIRKSIKKLCEENISKYSLPYEYEFRTSMPKTLVGKVAYKKLEEEEKNKRMEGE